METSSAHERLGVRFVHPPKETEQLIASYKHSAIMNTSNCRFLQANTKAMKKLLSSGVFLLVFFSQDFEVFSVVGSGKLANVGWLPCGFGKKPLSA